MKAKLTAACLTAAVVLLAATLQQARASKWQNPGTGNWSIDANWDPGEPGSGDDAYINNGGTAQITAPNDEVCDHLRLGVSSGDSGTVDMTGGKLSVSDWLYVGWWGDGTLNITGGHAVSNDAVFIGMQPGSTGAVTVNGAASTWTNSDDLYVGDAAGSLDITGDAEVSVAGDTWVSRYSGSSGKIHFDTARLTTGGLLCAADDLAGTGMIHTNGLVSDVHLTFDAFHGLKQTITIDKNPGQNITVGVDVNGSGVMGAGYAGDGTMTISDGRVVQSTRGYIGYKSGSTGAVAVEGPGSSWTNGGYLYVGRSGAGTLDIRAGGTVSSDWCYVGSKSGSSGAVTVDGIGSTWDCGPLVVSSYSSGTLTMTAGGAVSSSTAYIGYNSASTGVVTVDGSGSTWTNGRDLSVGREGTGTLAITGGGAVSNESGFIGRFADSTGAVTVDGTDSTWTNSGNLYVGAEGAGTLAITDGGLVSVADILIIDEDGDGDSFINMVTGGMLALFGDADDSIGEFLGLVNGTDVIQYWDGKGWDDITNADIGVDYDLSLGTGGLDGYTVLRVTAVPEPATLALLAAGGLGIALRRRHGKAA